MLHIEENSPLLDYGPMNLDKYILSCNHYPNRDIERHLHVMLIPFPESKLSP